MFSKKIIDSDAFTELPPTTQALYFHLNMNADDDGFNNKIRQAMFNAHADRNDYDLLINKRFIIPFDDKGIIVIKHWRLHNYIQNDRYHATEYVEEKAKLILKKNGVYTENNNNVSNLDTECIQDVYNLDTEIRLDKNSIDKNSIDKISIGKDSIEESIEKPAPAPKETKHTYGEYKHVKLTDTDITKLNNDYGEEMTKQLITFLDEYIEMKGYKAKSHYLCIKKWVIKAVKEQGTKKGRGPIRKEVVPEWLNKKIEKEEMSQEEQAEIENLLSEFKNDGKEDWRKEAEQLRQKLNEEYK